MIKTIEEFGNWSIANNAEPKIWIGIGLIVFIALTISFCKEVLKEK